MATWYFEYFPLSCLLDLLLSTSLPSFLASTNCRVKRGKEFHRHLYSCQEGLSWQLGAFHCPATSLLYACMPRIPQHRALATAIILASFSPVNGYQLIDHTDAQA